MSLPEFPTEPGEAVEFVKDGNQYRLLRVNEDLLFIHRAGFDENQFQLAITNISADGRMFDVFGTGHIGSVTGIGSDRTILNRLF